MNKHIELDRFGWVLLWEKYPIRAKRLMGELRHGEYDLRTALKEELARYDHANDLRPYDV